MILIWTNIIDFGIECIWMPKGCVHIASTESTECPEPRNQGGTIGHPIREFWEVNCFAYVQPVSYLQKWATRKTKFQHNSCLGINMKYRQVDRIQFKRWSIYWGMHPSIWHTRAPVKIICILDYFKTKACFIGVVLSKGLLLFHADVLNYWSLGTYLYKWRILRWSKWTMLCGRWN